LNLLLEMAAKMCVAPSKKKNCDVSQPRFVSTHPKNEGKFTFEAVKVLMTMIILAAMTASRPMIFMALITLRMMKPGPASRLLVRGILGERLLLRKETELNVRQIWHNDCKILNTYAYSEGIPVMDECWPAVNAIFKVIVGSEVLQCSGTGHSEEVEEKRVSQIM